MKVPEGIKRVLTSPKILAVIFVLVLVLDGVTLLQPDIHWADNSPAKNRDFYLGVTFGGNTTSDAKTLIDTVKNYTNIFVVDSGYASTNETLLNEVCDYAVASGFHIIVYFGVIDQYWQANWLDTAQQRWGEKFLGVYSYDEPGGNQLDGGGRVGLIAGRPPRDYAEASQNFVAAFKSYGRYMQMMKLRFIKSFTSDYGLYWFDYKAGYDVVFAEFAWNYSRQLNIALCRGAATMQDKEWGVIVTWTQKTPPYMESGADLYDDMVLAYNNGANYILVFDYPYNSDLPNGALQEEHFQAIQKLWLYSKANPKQDDNPSTRTAYVLPSDYGYGFRGPNDKIWGFWQADAQTNEICTNLNNLLNQYGSKLDIIYPDKLGAANTYEKQVYWNDPQQIK